MKTRLLVVLVIVCVAMPVFAGQMYEWIDDKGVKHFTNEEPPPGATIVRQEKEVPYDAEKDKARMERDRQMLKESQSKPAPAPAVKKETGGQESTTEVYDSGRDETWHQRQIQNEARRRQEAGNRPDTPKPTPHTPKTGSAGSGGGHKSGGGKK